jgi:hypothetical protein
MRSILTGIDPATSRFLWYKHCGGRAGQSKPSLCRTAKAIGDLYSDLMLTVRQRFPERLANAGEL